MQALFQLLICYLFLQSGRPTVTKVRSDGPTYMAPALQKRWPPPKTIDEDEVDMRTSTPLQHQTQRGGTVIRLGPVDDGVSNNTPFRKNSGGTPINRTQSLLINPSVPVNSRTNNRMNMLNSTLQSVPERDQRIQQQPRNNRPTEQGTYFIDTERSFHSLNPSFNSPKAKVIPTFYGKTPPPRPAPPSHYGSVTMSRTSESFRIPKSPPMFSDQLESSPPVRPIRRNKSKRVGSKTDSGTQTVRSTVTSGDIIKSQLRILFMIYRILLVLYYYTIFLLLY